MVQLEAAEAAVKEAEQIRKVPLKRVHCKKGLWLSRPHPGCNKPNSPWPGVIELFPARESLVSDIPAGDGKSLTLFYSV